MPKHEPPAATSDSITDVVDWARHFWDEQRLHGDERRFLAMSSLLRYQRLVVDEVEAALRAHRLNLTDYLVLMTLQLSESGTRLIGSLARSMMVHATTATLAADRLEKRRLLVRKMHPTDRRAICVSITANGRKMAIKATEGLSAIGFGMGGATSGDIDQLVELLATLRRDTGDSQ